MANSAFNHSPSIVVPGSSTNTALVRWSGTGADTFTDSTIIVGATTMGLAADTDLLTFGNGTIAITGAITDVTTITATTFSGALSGNATSATSAATLTTARNIGGVSFNGSAAINLPGVNATGDQNTTGSAATLTTTRAIGGVNFNGSAAINLPGVNAAGDQNTSGTAAGLSATLVVASGGTGLASYTAGDMFYYASGTALTKLAKGTADQVLTMNDGETAPGWETAAGGPSQATQSAIEAETNEDTYLPPDLISKAPSSVKAYCSVSSGGQLTANDYNVATIDDDGPGNRDINFTVAFSNAQYVHIFQNRDNAAVAAGFNLNDLTTGTVGFTSYNCENNAATDYSQEFVAMGDQ